MENSATGLISLTLDIEEEEAVLCEALDLSSVDLVPVTGAARVS